MTNFDAYIICATPRSGTTLLCDLLTDSGVAGCPDSFFRQQSLRWWADELGVPVDGWQGEWGFDRRYVTAVLQKGTCHTPHFGMRLMWTQVGNLTHRLAHIYPGLPSDKALIEAAFGNTCFIHLTRTDKVAQAISRIKAEQTGLWHRHADGRERERVKPAQPARYDPKTVANQVAEYEQHDAAWLTWFDQQGIRPITITYEALSEDPQATLAYLLQTLGQEPKIAHTIHPKTKKLADSHSLGWAARYNQEKQRG